jgi:hypothetical protein
MCLNLRFKCLLHSTNLVTTLSTLAWVMKGELLLPNRQQSQMMGLVCEYAAPLLTEAELQLAEAMYNCISILRMHSLHFARCPHV